MRVSSYHEVSWERMSNAIERVRQRLLRAAKALEQAGVPYAVAGGHAVAAWVSRVDEAAVRNTQDVDIILRRADLPAATEALVRNGFVPRHVAGMDMFLDGPRAGAPDVSESEQTETFRLLSLEALVRMKLTSFRDKDRVHLRDLIEVGLVDEGWLDRLPPPLKDRLEDLLANPEG